MDILALIFLILALVLVLVHGVGVRHDRLHFGWLGAAAYLTYVLLTVVPGL